MSRAAFRPFFNDTWRRKGGGGRRDLLLIKNNGAPMAPIGYNISQVAFIYHRTRASRENHKTCREKKNIQLDINGHSA